MATVIDRLGGRVIELYLPFEHQGRKIEFIRLKPIMFDHMLRWQQGAFASSLQLLVALSGEDESTLRMVRYPDVDRVLGAMMEMLPEAIRSDITSGVIPKGPAQPAVGNGQVPEPPGQQPWAQPEPAEEPEPFTGINEK